jgi:hypothetical protein
VEVKRNMDSEKKGTEREIMVSGPKFCRQREYTQQTSKRYLGMLMWAMQVESALAAARRKAIEAFLDRFIRRLIAAYLQSHDQM